MSNLSLAFRIARRELRGGLRGLAAALCTGGAAGSGSGLIATSAATGSGAAEATTTEGSGTAGCAGAGAARTGSTAAGGCGRSNSSGSSRSTRMPPRRTSSTSVRKGSRTIWELRISTV